MRGNTVQKWFGQAGVSVFKSVELKLSKPAVCRAAGYLLRFILGLCFSQAVIFGKYAPFGLGFVAAGSGVANGFSGFLGVLAGYFMAPEGVDGLKYVAAAVLIFSASLIFRDLRLYRTQFFMPVCAGAAAACVGIVFLAENGFAAEDTVLYAAEIVLAFGSAYFYRLALGTGSVDTQTDIPARSMKRVIGMLAAASTFLIPLARIMLPLGISAGRILAVAAVLMAAYYGGAGAGSAAGVCAGLSIDTVYGQPFFSMAFGFSGLVSGIISETGRLSCALAFLVASAAASLFSGDPGLWRPTLCETAAACLIFMLMPDYLGERLREIIGADGRFSSGRSYRVREHAGKRLEQVAQAFRELYDTLSSTFDNLSKTNDEDTATVFDRASNRVCRRCALAGVCWDREAIGTYNALNDLTQGMLEKGKVTSADFPPSFASRCLNLRAFVDTVNEELTALMYRRQYKSRLKESRSLVCTQYGELSKVLGGVAAEISADTGFDPEAERRIERYLKAQNIKAEVSVYKDAAGRAHTEIEGEDLSALAARRSAAKKAVSEALGMHVNEPEQQKGTFGERLIITEAAPLGAVMGVAAHRKKGQSVSGDSWTHFKSDSGALYVLLSDGMGSGKEAALESSLALRLLERFLRAGVPPAAAIKTLNSALVLRGGDEYAPVTLDIMSVDLFSGEITLYKCGAAPTYIKKGQKLSRVTCTALPAGTALPGQPQMDVSHAPVGDGDMIVMVSDGIASAQDDLWLYQLMEESAGMGPKELSCAIMERAMERYGRSDDMTVLVLGIKKRGRALKNAG